MSTSTSITAEEVKKLAALSRIKLSEEEVSSLQGEMGSILGYVNEINSLSLESIVPVDTGRKNIWREDGPANETGAVTEKLLTNAPREGNYVKVKKIF